MSYSSIFKKRMGAKGNSVYERNLSAKARSFQAWFDNSIGKEKVIIDGVEQDAIFQDQNQNNNKDLSDDKYMVVENSSNVKVGSYVVWRDEMWMVFTNEHKTIPTHKQLKVKQSNHYIKWMIDGRVSGDGQGYPAFIQNQTLYTLGVSTSGYHSWIVNAKMMMYLQDNPETRALKIGQRIFIGGAVFQIMFKDYVSRKGLINFLLEQDMINTERDDIVNEIADYHTSIRSQDESEGSDGTGISKEVTINGASTAKIGSLVTYEASVYQDGNILEEDIHEWAVADTEMVATVVEQTEKSITLRIEQNFKKVGSVITVIGKTQDGVIGSKSVNIISPY